MAGASGQAGPAVRLGPRLVLPPAPGALCRYVSEWTATKLRWDLAVDAAEQGRLLDIAAGCGTDTVAYTPAPQ
ncbi:hypothetical protein ACIPW5_36865 [Streptomyces sp. NPDC090077]|uniref:hypothetical protein n=1 Tax=Streptomyces sp. NPDC090077 TaxID=3365938 RepID=UPI00380767C0